jgi:acid stress-induced BolA-like protein IbaG/YrbA
MLQADHIKRLIEQGLPGSQAIVQGDDGVHFKATVISPAFAGKSLLQQHRLVYATLGGRMESAEIHALALQTYTPETWQQQSQ